MLQQGLGTIVCKHILFIHAFLGCDTTSAIFGTGKVVIFTKILQGNKLLIQQGDIFLAENSTVTELISTRENALLQLCNIKLRNLYDLRYHRFCEKVTKSTSQIDLKRLPPTAAAMSYHNLRVFLQIQQWKEHSLCPELWGWKKVDPH